MVASADYGDAMLAAFISELIAFLLYSWLFITLKNSKTILLKSAMAFSVVWGLFLLMAYVDIRGFLE